MADSVKGKTKAHCPECDGERKCLVHGAIAKNWHFEDKQQGHFMDGVDDYSLLECGGCETVFYQRVSSNSEDVDYWQEPDGGTGGEYVKHYTTYPRPESKTKPQWADLIHASDQRLGEIVDEAYEAFDAQLNILAAIGLRTAFDRASEVLDVDPGLPFAQKLNELHAKGMIGTAEKDVLSVVIDGGSAAIHRAHSFNDRELAELFAAMEVFLQRAFIVGNKALALRASIPPRN